MSKPSFRQRTLLLLILGSLALLPQIGVAQDSLNISRVWKAPQWSASDIEVSGEYAYVADGLRGLLILYVADVDSMVESGRLDTPGDARDVAVSFPYAYVADGAGGLRVIDVSNPRSPHQVGVFDPVDNIRRVEVDGSRAYVSTNIAIKVVDISSPNSPFEIGSVDIYDYIIDYETHDNLIYTLRQIGGDLPDYLLSIVDASDPENPFYVGSFILADDAVGVTPRYLSILDNVAFVAYYDCCPSQAGLVAIDVSEATEPIEISRIPIDTLSNAWSLSVADGFALVVDLYHCALINVTNPESMSAVGGIGRGPGSSVWRIGRITSGRAFLYNFDYGVFVYDIAEPATPSLTGLYPQLNSSGRAIAHSDSLVVLRTGSVAFNMQFDFENRPLVPFVKSVVNLAGGGSSKGVAIGGDKAYVTQGYFGIRSYGLSDPVRPSGMLDIDTPGDCYDLAYRDNLLYVADGSSGLRIYDVSDTTAPIELGSYDTPGTAYGIEISDSLAFIADYSSLQIINVSNPFSPAFVGSINAYGDETDVAVSGNFAYLLNYYYGLIVVDISNPATPVQVGEIHDIGNLPFGNSITIAGDYAYIATSGGPGLRVVDISNPTQPVQTGYYRTPGVDLFDLVVVGDHVYAASSPDGLEIFDCSELVTPPGMSLVLWPPNEVLRIGETRTIGWINRFVTGNAAIEICRDFPIDNWQEIAVVQTIDSSFAWTVTGPTSNDCRIRILSVTDPSIGDTMDGDFYITGTVDLVTPSGGEIWDLGIQHDIHWIPYYLYGNVQIQLKHDYPLNGWESIGYVAATDSHYSWTATGPASNNCRIRLLYQLDPDVFIGDTSDANFSLQKLSVLSPNGGEALNMGLPDTIRWDAAPFASNLKIDLNHEFPSGAWESLANSTPNDGEFVWNPFYPATENARIRVTSITDVTNADTSDANFIILPPPVDSLPGVVGNPNPPDGSGYIPESQVLSWSPAARAETYDVYVWRSSDNMPTSPTSTSSESYFDPNLLPGTAYSWKVRARNLYGETISPVWTFTTRALPDLQVTDIVYPQEIFSGQTIQIQWTISNLGAGPTVTPQWPEYVYTSPDIHLSDHDFLDIRLYQTTNLTYLEPGQSYTQTAQVTLPQNQVGYYYLFVSVDNTDAWAIDTVTMESPGSSRFGPVAESNDYNNFRYELINIQPSPTPDLRITATNVPAILTSGAQAFVSWTVQNQGEVAASGSWFDAVYISDDSSFSQNDTRLLLLPPPQSALLPDSSYVNSISVTIPNAISGPHWIIFRTDATESIWEFVGDNNNLTYLSSRDVILSPWPDFVVTHFAAEPTAATGYPVNMEWTVANQGAGQPFEASWNDRVYLSSTQNLNPSADVVLCTYLRTGSLEPGNAYNREVSPVIPVSQEPGSYYLHLVTDFNNAVFENGEDTNNSANPPLQITVNASLLPDIEATSLSLGGDFQAGSPATFTYRVSNVGDTTTGNTTWIDKIFVSDFPTFSDSAVQLASRIRQHALLPGEPYDETVNLTLPLTVYGQKYFYLFADATTQIYESNAEENNIFRTEQFTVSSYPSIDLEISNLSLPDSGASGQPVNLSWTVTNVGEGRTLANSWQDAIYLSADQIYQSGQDIRVNSSRHDGALNPDQSYTRSVAATLPNGVSGDFYVIGRTDTALVAQDNDALNNLVVSTGMIHVSLTPWADLAVTAIIAASEDTAGQPTSVQWTVQNIGPAATPVTRWYDAVYLSFNTQVDAGDILLGTYERTGALAPNESYSRQADVTIPGYTNGNYFLLVKTDSRSDLFEYQSEVNNVRSESFVAIVPPLCDLIVTNVQGPDSAMPGEEVVVTYTIENIGENRATGWIRDGVYLSRDSVLEFDDELVDIIDHYVDLLPGASVSSQSVVTMCRLSRDNHRISLDEGSENTLSGNLPPINPGNYFAIVKSDMRAQARDSDRTNNLKASESQIHCVVSNLIADSTSVFMTQGESAIYFSILVPDSQVGKSLIVDARFCSAVTSLEFLSATNRMPTSIDYDSRSTDHDSTGIAIAVPLNHQGEMFICLKPSGPVSMSFDGEIVVRFQGFAINSSAPSEAGQSGDITLRISGTGINPTLKAQLVGSVIDSPDQFTYWQDANTAFATFSLDALPLGIYDLRLVQYWRTFMVTEDSLNPLIEHVDSVEQTLSGALSVVASDSGGYDVEVFCPSTARYGALYPVVVSIANRSNNDKDIPLVNISCTPSALIDQPFDVSSFARSLVLVPCSKDGPGGILRPSSRVEAECIVRTVEQVPRVSVFAECLNDWQESPPLNELITWSGIDGVQDPEPSILRAVLEGNDSVSWKDIAGLCRMQQSFASSSAREQQKLQTTLQDLSNSLARLSQSDLSIPLVEDDAWLRDGNGGELLSDPCFWAANDYHGRESYNEYGSFLGRFLFPQVYRVPDEVEYTSIPYLDDKLYINSPYRIMDKAVNLSKGIASAYQLSCSEGGIHQVSIDLDPYLRSSPEWIPQFARTYFQDYSFEAVNGMVQSTLGRLAGIAGISIPNITGNLNQYGNIFGGRLSNVHGLLELESLPRPIPCNTSTCRISGKVSLRWAGEFTFAPDGCSPNTRPLSGLEGCLWELQCAGYTDLAQPFPISMSDSRKFTIDTSERESEEDCCWPPRPGGCRDNGDDGDGGDNGSGAGGGSGSTDITNPVDPNEILGPSGIDMEAWTRSGLKAYTVYFENDADLATAPAQVVHIELPIDSSLDPRSFRLGSLGFGEHFFDIPSNRSSYSQRLDLRDSLGVYVDFAAGVNLQTRELYWILESIDPSTGLPPIDPLSGFLLVNDSLGRGQGFVTFTIEPNADARTGEEITAQASIVFDINAPVETNVWLNTIDSGPPVSIMDTTAEFIDSLRFRVSWSAQDDSLGSGVAYYDLYCSVNEGPYVVVGDSLFDTTFTVRADWYNTYHFFALATDNVGNQEAMKTSGEITVEMGSAPGTNWVDSLVIKIDETDSGKFAQLFWPSFVPDSSDDQVGYWVYGRSNVGHDNAWYFASDAMDTTASFQIDPNDQVDDRFFIVIAYTYASTGGRSTRPRPMPVINLPEILFTPEKSTSLSKISCPPMKSDSTSITRKISPNQTKKAEPTEPDVKKQQSDDVKLQKN